MRSIVTLVLITCSFVALGSTSCATARRSEPLLETNQLPPTERLRQGERVFDTHCNGCHPGGAAGLGPALNNKPLPSAAVRAQVRAGVGAMPGFDEERISDDHLDVLVDYIDWLSEQDPKPQPETEDGAPEFP